MGCLVDGFMVAPEGGWLARVWIVVAGLGDVFRVGGGVFGIGVPEF